MADIIPKTATPKTRAVKDLHTPRLLLRQFVESDAAEANRFEADPAVVRYATHGVRSLADSLAFIQAVRAEAQAQTRRVFEFALVLHADGRLIGRCGMKLSDGEPSEAMLWYVLAREAWGNGYAAEAARSVISFGFHELRLHRIFVEIDPRNSASLRVAEKVGLRREGHFRETTWSKGEWNDSVVFALLDREYRARWLKAPAPVSQRG